MHKYLIKPLAFTFVVFMVNLSVADGFFGNIYTSHHNENNSDRAYLLNTKMNQSQVVEKSYKKLKYAGMVNFDLKPKTMQKNLPGEDENYLAISNMNLKGNLAITDTLSFDLGIGYFRSNKGQGDTKNTTGFILEDAYITYSPYKSMSLFIQAGRSYLPFGEYNRYVITPSLVQMLTEVQEENIQLGHSSQYKNIAFSIRGFAFQGTATRDRRKHQGDLNGGVALNVYIEFGRNFAIYGGTQYIYNMLDVNAIRSDGVFEETFFEPKRKAYYTDRTSGFAFSVNLRLYDTFELFTKHVTALNKSKHIRHHRDISTHEDFVSAKPSAWEIGTSLEGHFGKMPFKLDYSYQMTHDTAGLFVFNNKPSDEHPFPRIRYIIGMDMHLNKHTVLRVQWGHNFLYRAPYDYGRQGDDATIRLSVYI